MAPRRGLRSIRPIDTEVLDAEAADEVARFKSTGNVLADLLVVQQRLRAAEAAESEHRRERDLAIVSVARFWTVEHGAKFQDAVGVTNAGVQDIRKRRRGEDVADWADAPQRARRSAIASVRAGREAQHWRPLRNDLVRKVSAERGLSNLHIAQRTGLSPGYVSWIRSGVTRTVGAVPRKQAHPLTLDELHRMLATCDTDGVRGVRDKALLAHRVRGRPWIEGSFLRVRAHAR